jgi:hypothetical protein
MNNDSGEISPESGKIWKIGWNPVKMNLLLRRHDPGQICSFLTILGPKKIRKERKKKYRPDFAGFRQVFAGITVEGILEKKKFESAYIERN